VLPACECLPQQVMLGAHTHQAVDGVHVTGDVMAPNVCSACEGTAGRASGGVRRFRVQCASSVALIVHTPCGKLLSCKPTWHCALSFLAHQGPFPPYTLPHPSLIPSPPLLTCSGWQQAHHHVDAGGLACTIGAQQAKALPTLNAQVQRAHSKLQGARNSSSSSSSSSKRC
jgi:hypothetical protein